MIEKALYTHLQAQTAALTPYLSRYRGKLAVFNQEAPADTDNGWETTSQYGRIVFAIDLTEDPERKYSGTLAVDVLCESGKQIPEEMEPIVRELIDGYFFSTEETTISAQWSASNYFTTPTEKVIGVTLTFGLLAFPKQHTIDPDPIALFNKWSSTDLKEILGKDIRVIGYDTMPPAWKPTNEAPGIYWRLSDIRPCNWIPDTYNCSWQTATIYGHVLSQEQDTEAKIARTINNTLVVKKRLIFDDISPLMVDKNIRVNIGNDNMRVGQITIDGTYGILTPPRPYKPLNHANIDGKESNNGN